jgi:hypothetical protein
METNARIQSAILRQNPLKCTQASCIMAELLVKRADKTQEKGAIPIETNASGYNADSEFKLEGERCMRVSE